jgi:hypothetical protein
MSLANQKTLFLVLIQLDPLVRVVAKGMEAFRQSVNTVVL